MYDNILTDYRVLEQYQRQVVEMKNKAEQARLAEEAKHNPLPRRRRFRW